MLGNIKPGIIVLIISFLILISSTYGFSLSGGPPVQEIQGEIIVKIEDFEKGMEAEDIDMVMSVFKNGSEVGDFDLYRWMENDALEMFEFFDNIEINRENFDIQKVDSKRAMTTIRYVFRAYDKDIDGQINLSRVFLWLWEKGEGDDEWHVISVKATSPEVLEESVSSVGNSGSGQSKTESSLTGSGMDVSSGSDGESILAVIKKILLSFLKFIIGMLEGDSGTSSPGLGSHVKNSDGNRLPGESVDRNLENDRGTGASLNEMPQKDQDTGDRTAYGGMGQILEWERKEYVIGKPTVITAIIENVGGTIGKFTLSYEFRDPNNWNVEENGETTYILQPKEKKTVQPFILTANSEGKYLLIIKMQNDGLNRQDYAKSYQVRGVSR